MNKGCFHLHSLGRVDLTAPDGTQARSILTQPKRLALLLYLAAAHPRGFHRRDTLLPLFWPELPDRSARRALNRAIYYLRQSLGPGALVSRGDEELAVAEEWVWCDTVAFERAIDSGNPTEALQLYHGDFAPGFFVEGLADLERWTETERVRLRNRALETALGLAAREAEGGVQLAAHWAQLATTLAPYDERAVRRHMVLLDQAGDRAGALLAYEQLAARLGDELEVEPSPETRALEHAVRGNRREPAVLPSVPLAEQHPLPSPASPLPPRRRSGRSLAWLAGGALVGAGAVIALAAVRNRAPILTLGQRSSVAIAPEFERWPGLSPDGTTLFYTVSSSQGDELIAQQVQGGNPLPITALVPGSQRYGALSPEGKQLLIRQDDGLYVMPALGGQSRRVVPARVVFNHPGFQELAGSWAPDGRHIVYPERDTLFTQAIDGADRRALVTGTAIHSPAWSPDGRWIVFVEGNPDFHVRGNLGSSAIRVVSADGGATVAVTDASALNTSPIWVPGRQSLLFISDREGGRDIYQADLALDGSLLGAPVRITTGLNPERLAISTDGRRLAWSVLTETSNIRSIDVTLRDSIPLSQAPRVTTGNELVEAVGAISPDGIWLYYHSDRGGISDLWRAPLAGGNPERLTFGSAMNFAPAVSPDGRELAFHSLREGNRDIFVMPAAGGPAVPVSTSPDQEGVPAWSPDGGSLLWLSGDTIRMARRTQKGVWEPFESVLTTCGCGGWAQWSPDGRWISVPGLAGLELFSPTTGHRRLLGGGSGTTWHVWSPDGRTVYAVNIAGTKGIRILAISVADGSRRILAYSDDPTHQLERYGLAEHAGRLYFPLVERRADIWVADVRGR
jgi:Tol biopolymer transport system component/DNA-binding SARP family transcriptional activator